jgi:hypothetical protein
MKSALFLTSIICQLAATTPVWSQAPHPAGQILAPDATRRTAPNAGSRFADARRVIPKGGGRVEEFKGLLVLDPEDKELRFNEGVQPSFTVSYESITALHYEKAVEPSKWGWPLKDTKEYLTIHYADSAGRPAFETVRLSAPDVRPLLDALETHTGLKIDRTLAKQSFLGIPIRAAIGDRVMVTDQAGNDTEGALTQLSASSLALDGSVFDGSSVKTIRRTRSRGHDALRGFGYGAVIGGIAGGLLVGAVDRDARSAFEAAAILGGFVGGISAVVSGASASYRFRSTRDVYLGGTSDASKTRVFMIMPQLANHSKAVVVSLRF